MIAAKVTDEKIKKKDGGEMSIPLKRTKDILKTLGENKKETYNNNVKRINNNFNDIEETLRVGMLNYSIAKDTKFDFSYHKKQDKINSQTADFRKIRNNF